MARKRRRGRRPGPKTKRKLVLIKREALLSIIQISIWGAAGLVLISFSRQGALAQINDVLVDNFSWTAIFTPFLLLVLGFLLSRIKTPLGQPNVFIGALLFFLSITSLTKAGTAGRASWEGIAALVTGAGAFLVLAGTSIVGMVILFNTSIDQFLFFIAGALTKIRNFIASDAPAKGRFAEKKELKIVGLPEPTKRVETHPKEEKKEDLAERLVSNTPGDESVWNYPPLDLLSDANSGKADRGDIKGNAALIEKTLESFGVTARVVEVNSGPAVTQYALEVALGTKLSKITALERDLALALAAPTGTIRIEAPMPGRSLVGIELPNRSPEFVSLKQMLESETMSEERSKTTVSLGLDVSGKPVVATISAMPHVLIAGQTGSGKSVAINSFLGSLLFRASPSELKIILVDPKRVELTGYNGIPHLLTPVIVEPEKVLSALRWLLSEMDRRYKLFAQAGARNIEGYNEMSGFQALPYIMLIIDELADIMLFSPVEVENAVTRLAQMSRATGIHMILATQRPSVDVITGLIKANIPARIAFAVSSQVDSRVVLDAQGAEKLLGRGDMLYLSPEQAKPVRIQGSYVSDREINALVGFIREQGVKPQYTEEVTNMAKPGTTQVPGVEGDTDEFFRNAVELVVQFDRASASLIQRRLKVGYARAARILDELEAAGVVSPADGSKPRDVLIKSAEEIFGQAEEE